MSQFDKGFSAGILTAAKLARKASAQVQRAGVGAKFQGAFAALDALADDLEDLTKPEPDPPVAAVTQPAIERITA